MNADRFTARTLRRQFLFPLVATAAVVVLNYTILLYHTTRMECDAEIVNLAGRQRTLATRLGREATELRHAVGAERLSAGAKLEATVSHLEREHVALIHEREDFREVPEVRRILVDERLHADTERLIAAARWLVSSGASMNAANVESLQRLSTSVVDRTDRAVQSYEAEAHRRVKALMSLEEATLALTLATLAFIALRVFRPTASRIEAAQEMLAGQSAAVARHRDELASAYAEQRRLRETLEQERGFVSTVLDTIDSLVVVVDSDGDIVRSNERYERATGYSQEDIRGKPLWDFFVMPDDRARGRENFEAIKDGRFPARGEGYWRTRDGAPRLVSWTTSILRDAAGSPEFIVATGQDVTEARRLRRALDESEVRYSNVISHASEAILVLDDQGRLLEANRMAEELSGYGAEELSRLRLADLLREDGRPRFSAFFAEVLASGNARIRAVPLVTRLGETRFADLTASLVPMGDEHVIQAIVLDITERKRQQESIDLAARVFESSSDGILITDAKNTILQVNRAFEIITGYSREEVLGRKPSLLQSGRQSRDFYSAMWSELVSHGRWQGELWNRRKNGEIYAEWVTIDEVVDEDGDVRNYVGIFRDVTAQKALEDDLRRLANFDPLTGLPNRTLFHDRLEQALAHEARSGGKVVLMVLDLDRFKQINDTCGHEVGDSLLKEAARRLRGCLRESDTVARFGGDEFTIVLHDIRDSTYIRTVAEKIIDVLGAPFILDGQPRDISASIGVSIYPDSASDGVRLLRHADAAMYAAKRAGGACFRVYSPPDRPEDGPSPGVDG